jgi:hypothetical protein
VLKILEENYIFSSSISLSPLILLSKSDSKSGLNRLLEETPKLVVILFLSSSLIVIPLATSCVVYKRLSSLSSTSIISMTLLLIKIGASLLPLEARY